MYIEKDYYMTSKFDSRWNTYSFILIIQALFSLKAWFLWWIPGQTAIVLIFVISIFYLIYAPFWDCKDKRKISALVLVVILFLYQAEGNLSYYLLKLIESVAIFPFVLLKSKYQLDLLEKFQRVITVILTVSLASWILHLVGINFPSTPITYGKIDRGEGLVDQYLFDNHYVFLVNQSWMLKTFAVVPDFLRFCSVFLEPGILAILMVFLLYINKFDFREKRNQLYMATIIATVSLAGLLMVLFAYIAHSVQYTKRGTIGIIFLLILTFAGNVFFKDYNGGRNFINEGLIERLEVDDERGIAGNNRTTLDFDYQFERIMASSDIIGGIGNRKFLKIGGANVGYKAFIVRYGFIGLALFLSYLILLFRTSKNYRAFVLLLLYILMFIRGDGPIFWSSFVLIYTCGLTLFKYEKKNSSFLLPSRS